MHKLTEPSVSKCYFVYENGIWLLQNAGPPGFLSWIHYLKIIYKNSGHKAIKKASNFIS